MFQFISKQVREITIFFSALLSILLSFPDLDIEEMVTLKKKGKDFTCLDDLTKRKEKEMGRIISLWLPLISFQHLKTWRQINY